MTDIRLHHPYNSVANNGENGVHTRNPASAYQPCTSPLKISAKCFQINNTARLAGDLVGFPQSRHMRQVEIYRRGMEVLTSGASRFKDKKHKHQYNSMQNRAFKHFDPNGVENINLN